MIEINAANLEAAVDILDQTLVKEFVIKSANIKDDFCNYTYEVASGVGIGDKHKVDGQGIIKRELREAFAVLNVHLAVVDDIFKHSGVEIEDIDTMHGHELTTLYSVTGFRIKGGAENESIILIGNKFVSSSAGRIELESPQILIESTSSYKWYNELKAAADQAREEVEKYKKGNYIPVEEDEDIPNPKKAKQTKMNFMPPADGEASTETVDNDAPPSGDDSDFENGKV